MQGLKPRLISPLIQAEGKWVDELPSVLWSLRTTPNRSIGYTPFFMVYGAEAVLPSNIEYDSPRVRAYDEEAAEESRKDDIDTKEEARLIALERTAVNQQKLCQYQGRRVRAHEFNIGDLVLRLKQKPRKNKPSFPWEGPYIIHEDRAYRLRNRKIGQVITCPWNAAQLCLFYAKIAFRITS